MVAFAALVTPFLACGSTASGSNTGTAAAVTSATTGSKPMQSARAFNVGDTVKLGSWTVKVNSVKANAGGDFTKPKSGNVFVVINVTVTNIASSTQNISSALNFKLADSTGQSYTETFTDNQKTPPDGTVATNSNATGDLSYEVPKSETHFTLLFQPDLSSNDQAAVNITVQ